MWEELVVILQRWRTTEFIFTGGNCNFYWKKVTHESLDVVCPDFNVEIIKMRQYLSNILKFGTLIDDMK